MVPCGPLIRPVPVRRGQVDHLGTFQAFRDAIELPGDALQGDEGARHLAQRTEHDRQAGSEAGQNGQKGAY
jgi:hypothetical protein